MERETIISVALDVLSRDGLDGLSTRSLAVALNVQGPSLYHHIRNKRELLGEMAAVILQQSLSGLDWKASWDVWLQSLAHATRNTILEYRDGARLLTTSWPTASMRAHLIPSVAQPLIADGFPPILAHRTIGLIASFVIGWTMHEQNDEMRLYLDTLASMDGGFDHGVETIISGTRQMLATATSP